jgi:hypothetical protein
MTVDKRTKPIELCFIIFLPKVCLLKKLPLERIFSEHTDAIISHTDTIISHQYCLFNILLGCPFKQILFFRRSHALICAKLAVLLGKAFFAEV